MFFPRRGPAERSFACAVHEERANGAVGAHDDGVSDIPPDRPRCFEELYLEAMLARWREYRAGQRSAA
jgi:hypothetical protein